MQKSKALACAAAVALPMALTALPAQAHDQGSAPAYREPEVAWVHQAKAKGDRATVLAKYRCWGGNEGTHVWVSLKQGGKINDYTAQELSEMEGTSALARAWYDTNPPQADQSTVYLICNGRWQVQKYTLGRVEGKGRLHRGRAFLQFCLFDSKATEDLSHGFAYEYKFIKVSKKHHHHHWS
jgi:hypothetical protein